MPEDQKDEMKVPSPGNQNKWDRDTFHDFVVTHGFGPPSEEGYLAGFRLFEQCGDYALVAAEIACRGLTTVDEPRPAVICSLESNTQGMRCPGCGSTGPFKVAVSGHVSVEVPNHGMRGRSLKFDGGSQCACESCDYTGTVRDFRPATPGTYTAVLLYPDYATGDYGADIFVECATAREPEQAAHEVQKMASVANDGDIPAEDFRVIAVFAGDHSTVLDATSFVPDGQSI